MSPDDNKAVIRKLFATIDAHDLATLEHDFLASDYCLHFDSMPVMDRQHAMGSFSGFIGAFPDISHTVEDIIAEGDRVGCRITVRGTQQGELMGIPATNRPIAIASLNTFRLEDGRVVEQQINSDGLGMLQQLGVIPGPDQQQGRAS